MGLFAIGVPLTSETTGSSPYGPFLPQLPDVTQFTLAGAYGQTLEIAWYSDIRDPNTLSFQAAPPVAINPIGTPLVVSYDKLVWGYNKLRPDEWYYLKSLNRLARRGNTGYVRIKFPQPSGIVETSAVWEQIPQSTRNVGHFAGMQLTFSQLGRADGAVPDLVWLPFPS